MKKTIFSIGLMCLAGLALSAQEAKTLPVKNNVVEIRGIQFPVYPGVQEVKVNEEGGLEYYLKYASDREVAALIEKIKDFYQGKKIGKFTIALKILGDPAIDTTYSFRAGTDGWGKGASVTIVPVIEAQEPPNSPLKAVKVFLYAFAPPEGP